MLINRKPRSEQYWLDIFKDCQENGNQSGLLHKDWNPQKSISLLAHEIIFIQ
jgi:hypothetical protein